MAACDFLSSPGSRYGAFCCDEDHVQGPPPVIAPRRGHHLMRPATIRPAWHASSARVAAAAEYEKEHRSVLAAWLRRSGQVAVRPVRELAQPAARRIARVGGGGAAAAGMVLGSWLSAPAAGAQSAGTAHLQAGGLRRAVEWAGSRGTRSTRRWLGRGLSRSAGSAGGRRWTWPRSWRMAGCPSTTDPR